MKDVCIENVCACIYICDHRQIGIFREKSVRECIYVSVCVRVCMCECV